MLDNNKSKLENIQISYFLTSYSSTEFRTNKKE